MNRIFSKVWSKALGRLVVASELASRQGSGTSRGATVSAGPINRSLLGAAVVAAMMGLPTEVLAGNGIHINSGSDGECVSINEPGWSPFTQTQTQLLNNNINFKDTDPKCGAFPNSPNGVLFYRPAAVDGVGATSLGLGGDLWVNGKVSLNPTGLARIDVKSLAFGLNATATNANDWAIGEGAKADSAEKRDAETGAAGNALAIGNNSLAEHTEALALGLSTRARAPLSTAVGRSASIGAGGHSATAVGRFAQANGHSTTAIGRDTIARAEQSTAVGYGARTGNNASRAVAIGASAQAIGLESLAMGSGAMVSAGMNNAVAIGKDSRGNAADTVAIGVGAVAEHFNSVALGTAARTAPHRVVSPTDLNGTRYNFLPPGLAEANVNGVVSVGSEAVSRQLVNVAPGVLDATSYDAVNGSQLFAAYQEINKLGQKDVALAAKDAELEDRLNKLPKGIDGATVAAAIGPGTQVDGNGRLSLPQLALKSLGRQPDDVTVPAAQPTSLLGAIDALDGEMVKINGALGVLFDNALLWHETEGAYSAQKGAAPGANRIANVAAGTGTQDAVNVGQLREVERTAQDAGSAASTAQRAADAAQATADEAKAAAGSASTQLAGIGPQETVAGRIKDAGQSVANALGGGASANADGTVSAPSYGVAAINADGSIGEVTQHGNVGGALTALDQNIGTVNERVDGLARDSLRWNEDLGAYDAARDGQASSQIANVAAGVKTTDAVNVGQLNVVDQAAKVAQSAAQAAQFTADGAQRTADGAASAASQAQATADSAASAANAAAADAGNAQRAADAAQVTANEAKAAAGAANTQLAGIGPQETVAGRIKDAGQSVADALGGGASANADGSVSAPSYGVAAINADGSTGEVTQHGNVGGALGALDQNIGTVNDRVDGLARDSLRWNEDLGAYDAAHDGQASSQIANVAAGVKTTDAVNVGQLNTVDQAAKAAQSAAQAAQSTADGATSAANQAQATADSAVTAAAAAATDAGNAQRAADAAQVTANEARAVAGAASTQLAGIGPQETVAGRIKDAGQSVANALGGGVNVNADGTVSAPSYGVAAINADGSTGEVTQHGNVGGALNALDQNIGTVNDRVDGLARDSLRWNENLGAYDAAHDGQASSQIANVAAGVKTTDAVNVSQLNVVDQAAQAAQSVADAASSAADGAQRTADDATARAATAQATADRVGGVASAALQAANSAGEGVIRTAAEVEQTRNQIVRGEIGLVKKDPQSKSLTIGKDTGGNELDVSGHEGGRRVTGIAVGRIDDASTDAVTGAQLNALDKRVQRADALGEGVAVDRPSSEQPAARAEVGSGAVAVGAGTSASGTGSVAVGQGAATTGAQATALGKDAVASAPGSVALGAGSRADRPNALSVGAAGAERQITHVAPATRDTDAVNLGQARSLSRQEASWALVQANGYTDRQIKQLRREANAGIALSMSMAGLPSSFVPGGRMIAMAGSTYGGESAVALGFSAVSEDGSFMLRASGSTTTEDHGFTIGVGFQW
ncbi:ESPR-type extended signal peptide-containing protein [Stenotrophomonas maltophilia]|uniref:ESPR-type extended signal peptide-containing protein n=1 Tax=Stenotrophomonas maltophilia TaxID=40324 RepID=UPI0021C97D1E|nr:ESPR-type extended signal peptide-containing protein [Stenotrophomonas maltophilia]MCU1085019.1 YadA-like family protein [Stenotrophomonas maltophilia]